MWPSGTSGCATANATNAATNKQTYYTLDFDATNKEYAECQIAMPSDYNGGTVTATFYWTATGTSTASVVWNMQGTSYGDSETIDASWGSAQQVSDAHTATANQLQITSATSAITLAGTPAASEWVAFRVARLPGDASDTLAVDALLIGVMVAYTRS